MAPGAIVLMGPILRYTFAGKVHLQYEPTTKLTSYIKEPHFKPCSGSIRLCLPESPVPLSVSLKCSIPIDYHSTAS